MSITGLHSCKPGNEPKLGQVKNFVIIDNPATETKKAWTKIKAALPDQGGQPYRILSAKPTGFTDSYGNVSFNLELDAAPTAQPVGPRSSLVPARNGDDRSNRIERQHSQEMAIRYFGQRGGLKGGKEGREELRMMIDWFQMDVGRMPIQKSEPVEPEPEPEPEMPSEPAGEEPY